MEDISLGNVTMKRIKQVVDNLSRDFPEEEDVITFELLMASLFPEMHANFKELVSQYYIAGFYAGQHAEKVEEK